MHHPPIWAKFGVRIRAMDTPDLSYLPRIPRRTRRESVLRILDTQPQPWPRRNRSANISSGATGSRCRSTTRASCCASSRQGGARTLAPDPPPPTSFRSSRPSPRSPVGGRVQGMRVVTEGSGSARRRWRRHRSPSQARIGPPGSRRVAGLVPDGTAYRRLSPRLLTRTSATYSYRYIGGSRA